MRKISEVRELYARRAQLGLVGIQKDMFSGHSPQREIVPGGFLYTELELLQFFKNTFPRETSISDAYEFIRLDILSRQTHVDHLPSNYNARSVFTLEFQNYCTRLKQIDDLVTNLQMHIPQLEIMQQQEAARAAEVARQAEAQRQAAIYAAQEAAQQEAQRQAQAQIAAQRAAARAAARAEAARQAELQQQAALRAQEAARAEAARIAELERQRAHAEAARQAEAQRQREAEAVRQAAEAQRAQQEQTAAQLATQHQVQQVQMEVLQQPRIAGNRATLLPGQQQQGPEQDVHTHAGAADQHERQAEDLFQELARQNPNLNF